MVHGHAHQQPLTALHLWLQRLASPRKADWEHLIRFMMRQVDPRWQESPAGANGKQSLEVCRMVGAETFGFVRCTGILCGHATMSHHDTVQVFASFLKILCKCPGSSRSSCGGHAPC